MKRMKVQWTGGVNVGDKGHFWVRDPHTGCVRGLNINVGGIVEGQEGVNQPPTNFLSARRDIVVSLNCGTGGTVFTIAVETDSGGGPISATRYFMWNPNPDDGSVDGLATPTRYALAYNIHSGEVSLVQTALSFTNKSTDGADFGSDGRWVLYSPADASISNGLQNTITLPTFNEPQQTYYRASLSARFICGHRVKLQGEGVFTGTFQPPNP